MSRYLHLPVLPEERPQRVQGGRVEHAQEPRKSREAHPQAGGFVPARRFD